MQKIMIFAAMGLEMGGLVLAARWLGSVLDERYHTNGLIFVGLSLAFLAGWLTQVLWMVSRFQKSEESGKE